MAAIPAATVYVITPQAEVRATLGVLFLSVHIRARYYDSAQAWMPDREPGAPGCVVADMCAPGVDGAGFLRRQRRRGMNLPVILLSDSDDVPTAVEALKAGAWDYLCKPFNGQILLDSVHGALEQARIGLSRHAVRRELQSRFDSLTPRERDVVVPMVQGLSNREIAERLGVSPKTVEVYRSRIMRKTRADNLCSLIRMAIRVELLAQPSREGVQRKSLERMVSPPSRSE